MKKTIIAIVALVLIIPALALAQTTKFTKNLRYGLLRNAGVKSLQTFLKQEGFYKGAITGNYLAVTKAAVKAFQKEMEISPANGIFSGKTRAAANEILAAEDDDDVNQNSATDNATRALFQDSFSDFPGNNWTFRVLSGGISTNTAHLDTDIGNPAPSIFLPFSGSTDINANFNPVNSKKGFTISFDAREMTVAANQTYWARNLVLWVGSQSHSTERFARVLINSGTQETEYFVQAAFNGSWMSRANGPYMIDSNFHTYKLVVDANGNASWYRDGVMKVKRSGFPVDDYTIRIWSTGNSNWYGSSQGYNVDNISITTS